MKSNCAIVQDLLPLYIDEILSEESKQLVEEHLNECDDCKEIYYRMKKNMDIPTQMDEEKVIKKFTLKIKKSTLGYLLSVTLFLVFWVLKYLNQYNNYYLDINLNHRGHVEFSSEAFFDLICLSLPYALGAILIGILYYGIKDKGLKKRIGKIVLLTCMILFTCYRNAEDFSIREEKGEWTIEKVMKDRIYVGIDDYGEYIYEISIPKGTSKLFNKGEKYYLFFYYNNEGKGWLISVEDIK